MNGRTILWRLAWLAACAGALGIGVGGRTNAPQARAASPPSWMKVDAPHQRVSFTVTAADGGANGTLNFNGYANGRMTVTVPAGWHVHIDFVNSGAGALPHSFEVIRSGKIPTQGIPPAIPGAESRDLIAGVPPMQKDAFDFTAAPAGQYLWLCGFPTHGTSGMWDRFVVSGSVKAPAVTVK
ncbi:MAG TPA: sulfocyanin-like copper-binding protein [bacterium]|nr:sulfocyanin-like copper-binding protein [bacterium]